jgi:GNAT superfamily N-acetyltransferase
MRSQLTDDVEPGWTLRRATMADVDALEALMKLSIRDIFPAFYDARQTSSSEQYVGVPDRMLIEDGTYFVIEEEHEVIACGGWSRRDKLYTGSGQGASDARLLDPAKEPARVRAMFVRGDRTRRGLGTAILEACEAAARAEGFRTMALMATLPGLQLYQRFGFVSTGPATDVRLPDGVLIACVPMDKPVEPTRR